MTVQNKVDPEMAKALHDDLSSRFVAGDVGAIGLEVWYYVGGPWRPAATFSFNGRDLQPANAISA